MKTISEILVAAAVYTVILGALHFFLFGDWPPIYILAGFAVISYDFAAYVWEEAQKVEDDE